MSQDKKTAPHDFQYGRATFLFSIHQNKVANNAAPSPCNPRKAIKNQTFGAIPQNSELMVNIVKPRMYNRFLLQISPNFDTVSTKMAIASK